MTRSDRTMNDGRIKNLQELLSDYFGTKRKIASVTIHSLIERGEKYGSIMVRVLMKIENLETGAEEEFDAVAKLLNDDVVLRRAFNNELMFRSDFGTYTSIIPTLRLFQDKVGVKELIDWSANVYGARMNLNGSDIVDDDACIILENLRKAGFIHTPRRQGFTFESAKLVLKSLASFHAVPLALKLTDVSLFERIIRPYCVGINPHSELFEEYVQRVLNQNEKFRNKLRDITIWRKKPPAREPFATMIHGDLWTYNTMQKYVDGKVVQNKIIDFQTLNYGSPSADVYMFLLTSVNMSVLDLHLDDLIKYYHEQFVNILDAHGCDTVPFSYQNFMEEWKLESKFEFGHALLYALFTHHPDEKEVKSQKGLPYMESMMNSLTEYGRRHAYYVAGVCLERGWY